MLFSAFNMAEKYLEFLKSSEKKGEILTPTRLRDQNRC